MSSTQEWLGHEERSGRWRFALSLAVVLCAYTGVAAAYQLWDRPSPTQPAAPALMMEFSPEIEAPQSPHDVAPGPEMVEAPPMQAPPPPPPVSQEIFESLPQVIRQAEVMLPLVDARPKPPQETPAETEPVDEPPPPIEEPPPVTKPPEPDPVVEKRPPAPRTTAPPRSQRRPAPTARAPTPGETAAARSAAASWQSLVVSRLQSQRRYPPSSRTRREEGVVTLQFTVNRNGGVTARGIARGSGYPALDQEALAMVGRAAPFPPFPSTMPQATVNLTVPIRFSLR